MITERLSINSSIARKRGVTARRKLSHAQRLSHSNLLSRRLTSIRWYQDATIIAAYRAMPHEANIDSVIQHALSVGKTVVVPCIDSATSMRFVAIDNNTQWRVNGIGIAEPIMTSRYATHDINPSAIDLMCVPLTAFDAQFNRVGMGGGYYDRYLGKRRLRLSAKYIGVAFSTQFTPRIAVHSWDIGMDAIATEHGVDLIAQR